MLQYIRGCTGWVRRLAAIAPSETFEGVPEQWAWRVVGPDGQVLTEGIAETKAGATDKLSAGLAHQDDPEWEQVI